MPDSRLGRGLHGGKDILQPHLPAERALQPVPERGEHDFYRLGFLGKNHGFSSIFVTLVPGKIACRTDVSAATTAGSPIFSAAGKTRMIRRMSRASSKRMQKTQSKAAPQITTSSLDCILSSPCMPDIRSFPQGVASIDRPKHDVKETQSSRISRPRVTGSSRPSICSSSPGPIPETLPEASSLSAPPPGGSERIRTRRPIITDLSR